MSWRDGAASFKLPTFNGYPVTPMRAHIAPGVHGRRRLDGADFEPSSTENSGCTLCGGIEGGAGEDWCTMAGVDTSKVYQPAQE
jgi:hypothetical protein